MRLYLREPGTGWRDVVEEADGSAYTFGHVMGERDAVAGLGPAEAELARAGLGAYVEGYSDGYHDAAPF